MKIKINIAVLFFLVAALLSFSFQANCFPGSHGTYGDNISWVLKSSGQMTITGEGELADATSGTVPWRGLEKYIFNVAISDGVTRIGNYVFYGCSKLSTIIIPDSVSSIGEYAFCGCNIKNIKIPKNVCEIKDYTFAGCSFNKITIPDSITKIGDEAFSGCQSLTEVTIGTGVTSIGVGAFRQCTSLNNIVLGNGLKKVYSEAFRNCINLNTICFGGTESQWHSITIDNYNTPFQSAKRYYHKHNDNTATTCSNYVAPTCTEYGFSGDVFYQPCGIQKTVGTTIEPIGHNYIEYTVPATCTEEGKHYFKCSNCGDYSSEKIYDALGHEWDLGTITTEATCTQEGIKTFTCKHNATHTYTETISALGHSYTTTVIPPTCEEIGYSLHTCTRCEDFFVTDTKAALGHDWNTGETTTEPTCTKEGVITFTCSHDSLHTYTETIPATGHSFGTWVQTINPTVYADGEETQTCSKCGEKNTRKINKLPLPVVAIQNFTVSTKTYDYRSTIRFKADVENSMPNGQIQWYVDGKLVHTGDTYTASDVRKSFDLVVKYTDGITVLSQTDTEKVNINTSFFAKLQAFFRAFFLRLPKIVQDFYCV